MALYDNLHPNRIIMGLELGNDDLLTKANIFAKILEETSLKDDIPVLFMDSTEAESVKLFSNTYLAMRIAYFNELDTFTETKGLSTENIIKGVSLDPRIGNYYNNPSFGYGGYCLPKDTKQLFSNYEKVPQNLMESIIKSNSTRKSYIVKKILQLISNNMPDSRVIGIFRLTMNKNSDNFRESSIQSIIKGLHEKNVKMIIYEPMLKDGDNYLNIKVVNNLEEFKNKSSIIIANRFEKKLEDVKDKVYTRDLFMRD